MRSFVKMSNAETVQGIVNLCLSQDLQCEMNTKTPSPNSELFCRFYVLGSMLIAITPPYTKVHKYIHTKDWENMYY